MADAVTPVAGVNSEVLVAGTSVVAANASPNGGFITNPADAPGYLFVDPVVSADVVAGGTTFGLAPGQSWSLIPGQTTQTTVNSNISNHVFSVVVY